MNQNERELQRKILSQSLEIKRLKYKLQAKEDQNRNLIKIERYDEVEDEIPNNAMLYKYKCLNCNKEYVIGYIEDKYFFKIHKHGKYCSHECRENYLRKKSFEKDMIDNSTRFLLFEKAGFKCEICGRSKEDGIKLQIDHWIPKNSLQFPGIKDKTNLKVLCNECNLSKKDFIVKEEQHG